MKHIYLFFVCIFTQSFAFANHGEDLALFKVQEFLTHNNLAVLSTINTDGKSPRSTLMTYAQNENFELYFYTFEDTIKYENLKKNPNVSFLIGHGMIVVQYAGVASEINKNDRVAFGEFVKAFREKGISRKDPCLKEEGIYFYRKEARLFKISPKHIKFSNFNHQPVKKIELFFSKNGIKHVQTTGDLSICNPKGFVR